MCIKVWFYPEGSSGLCAGRYFVNRNEAGVEGFINMFKGCVAQLEFHDAQKVIDEKMAAELKRRKDEGAE